jgi:hypothetical protein
LDYSENSRPRQNTQIKFQGSAEAEFDAEIALALAASHWRTAADRGRGVPKGAVMTGAPHLRLIPAPPPPRPRRHEARIVVSAARLPIGRSRVFRLAESDIDELIAIATRIERRR